MSRLISLFALFFTCAVAAGCGKDNTPTTPVESPTQITESFMGTLDLHGAAMYTFSVSQGPGQAVATLESLSPDSAAQVSFMFGTWNGSYCSVTFVKDDATTSTNFIGTASVGAFCVRVADVGHLTAPTDYVITVTHF